MRSALSLEVGSFHYGSEIVQFTVRRQPQRHNKTITIHVDPEGVVWVDAAIEVSCSAILIAVRKRARWIHSHLSDFLRRRAHILPREYVSGESVMYLGRRYRLKVVATDTGDAGVRLLSGYLEVRSASTKARSVRDAMEHWFRARARIVFSERMRAIVSVLGWKQSVPPIRLQTMKVQWGSCSPAGRLTLNPWLVRAPRDCIDYVILHELCHLKEHNHSAKFYRLLDKHMPGWRDRKTRLDELAEAILNR